MLLSGLSSRVRTSRAATMLTASLALAGPALFAAGCSGGGGGGGSDPQYGAIPLTVVDMDLDGLDSVSLNTPLTLEFSDYVAPGSIRPDTVQIRLGPRYGIQAFGEFKIAGNLVTFYPRMPTISDLSDAGFRPQSQYRVTVVGAPKVNHVKAFTGRPLTRTFVGNFSTAAATDPDLFTPDSYKDAPPPTVRFTNPPDVLPVSPWTAPGGALNVPTDAEIAIVLFRVPLLPSTVTTSNVQLTMIERYGIAQSRPIQGTPLLDQSFDTVSVRFVPSFPLADQARYVLRLDSRITDLTGNYDLSDNANRTALRTLADGGSDPALSAFAVAHPEEVDPRTFLIFTTRDEPVKDRTAFLNFDGTDRDQSGGNGLDSNATTASFNQAIAGAVAATFTAAGGTGVLGDFAPISSTTLSSNSPSAVNGAFNYRSITVNTGVTITVTGTLPASLLSLKDITINTNGAIGASGGVGDLAEQSYNTSSLPPAYGGAGNAGGGRGGDSWTGSTWANVRGGNGSDAPFSGGGGGQGGLEPNSTVYGFGGGGGGGGHQYAGSNGGNGSYPSYASWNGTGGSGGAAGGIVPTSAATSHGKDWYFKGVGGGGGGAGGNSHYYPSSTNWRNGAAGGGGGGGGLLMKSAANIVVKGRILSLGGRGGNVGNPGYYYYGAAGGGGGGGAIALYANDTLDVRGGTLDTSGGAGGAAYTYGWGGPGGKGGSGFIQLEAQSSAKILGDTSGETPAATLTPDFATGIFNPIGTATDAPSIFTSTWFNMGVFDPVMQPLSLQDFTDSIPVGCTIKYELQMAIEDPTNFGKADTSSISVSTGASSNYNKASDWKVINDTSGPGLMSAANVDTFFNNLHYQFYRVRVSFTLKDGQNRTDPVPYVDRLRFRVKY